METELIIHPNVMIDYELWAMTETNAALPCPALPCPLPASTHINEAKQLQSLNLATRLTPTS